MKIDILRINDLHVPDGFYVCTPPSPRVSVFKRNTHKLINTDQFCFVNVILH